MKKFFSILCALAIVLSASANVLQRKSFTPKVKKIAAKQVRAEKKVVKTADFKQFNAKDNVITSAKFAKAPQAKKATVDLTFTSADSEIDWDDYCAEEGWWQIQAENDEYYVSLSNKGGHEVAAGSYAWADMDDEYSCMWITGVSEDYLYFTDGSCTVTVTDEAVVVAGTFTCEDGNTYNISITYETEPAIVPEKKGEYTLIADNLDVYDGFASLFGVVILEASDENVSLELYAYADAAGEALVGNYVIGGNEANAYGYVTGEAGEVELYNGEFAVAFNNGSYTVTGVTLAYDSIEYTFALTFTMPDVTREENITIDSLEFIVYDFGAWQIAGYNADKTQYVSIAAYTEEIAGTYTTNDLAADYSYVVTDIEGSSYNRFSLVEANLTVTIEGENGVVKGDFKGFDGETTALFHLNLTGLVGEPEDTAHPDDQETDLNFNFAEYEVDDTYLAQYGSVYVKAMDTENMMYAILDITLPDGAEGLVAGEYEFAEEYSEQTVYAGLYDATYGYIPSFFCNIVEEEGKLYYGDEFWWPVEGKITITESLVVEVDAVNSKGAKIQLRIGTYPEAIDNVDADKVATKSLKNGQLIIRKNGVDYNAQGAIVK